MTHTRTTTSTRLLDASIALREHATCADCGNPHLSTVVSANILEPVLVLGSHGVLSATLMAGREENPSGHIELAAVCACGWHSPWQELTRLVARLT